MAPRSSKAQILISSSQRSVRVPRKRLTDLITFIAAAEGAKLGYIDLAVVSRSEITALNRRYLGVRDATDVLSFDLSDSAGEPISAQIVICGDVAADQAARRGCGIQRELMLYTIHGLLHLMGYDDDFAGGSAKMHARQDELLDEFFRTRPKRKRRA